MDANTVKQCREIQIVRQEQGQNTGVDQVMSKQRSLDKTASQQSQAKTECLLCSDRVS